jgi:hypothetical protein
MSEEPAQLEFALQPDEVWEDYELKTPDNHLAGFFSTYWTDIEEVNIPATQFTAEFARYTVSMAEHRPSAVYSGVVQTAGDGDQTGIDEAFLQFVELAYDARDTPVISYSQGDITSVDTVWTAGEANGCVAVIEAGCAGYFQSHLTLIERHDGVLIRTSIKPGHDQQYKLRDMFAHGFQSVVRNRITDTPNVEVPETLGIEPDEE